MPVVAIVRLVGPLRGLLVALIHLILPTSPTPNPYIAALKKRKLGQLALVSAMVILIGHRHLRQCLSLVMRGIQAGWHHSPERRRNPGSPRHSRAPRAIVSGIAIRRSR